MRHLRNRDGFIKPLLIIVVLAFAAYVGLKFGIPYYRYSAFKIETTEIARLELGNLAKTRAQVMEAAHEYKIPVEEKDIVVTVKTNTVRVQTSWSVMVDIMGFYQKTLHFNVDVEE